MSQDEAVNILEAEGPDAEWCAQLMATSDPWLRLGRKYEDCLKRCVHPEYLLLLGWKNGERKGFLLLHPRGMAGSPYIAALAVAAEVRGEGVGTALLDAAERAVPEARHILLCVSSFNDRARSLYESRGYGFVGELRDYVIEGASEVILHKRLVKR